MVSALGVPHEELRGEEADYPDDWAERARRAEYQFVDHAWLMPLARRIAGVKAPVLDGMAIDVTFQAGDRFYTAAALDTSRPRAASEALFDAVRRYGHAQAALSCKRCPSGTFGMVEVVGRVVRHPDPLHDALRADVQGRGHRHDLVEAAP